MESLVFIPQNAWKGLSIVIYGKQPLIPMEIEQRIAAASPATEIALDSFEDYEQALDHCKKSKTCGLVILIESANPSDLAGDLSELSKPYESRGFPCFCLLLHTHQPTLQGYKLMRSQKIIDYLPLDALLKPNRIHETLSTLWNKYIDAFEAEQISPQLQETLLSCAASKASHFDLHFKDRVSRLVSSDLNLSWLDTFRIRWSSVIETVSQTNPDVLKPHTGIVSLCKIENYASLLTKPLQEIASLEIDLWKRVVAITEVLNAMRISGSLSSELKTFNHTKKFSHPAAIRTLIRHASRLVEIANQEAKSA